MKIESGESAAALLLQSPRSACNWRALLPMAAWLIGIEALCGWVSAGPRFWIQAAGLVVGLPLAQAWVALQVVEDVSGRLSGLPERWRRLKASWRVIYSGPLFTLLVPALCLALALAVAVVGRLPWVGSWLANAWALTGGALLCLVASYWLLFGVPAMPFQVVGAIIDSPQPVEAASRAYSFVRRKPLLLCASYVGGALGAALGTLVFALFLLLCITFLSALAVVAAGIRPDSHHLVTQCLDHGWDALACRPFAWLPGLGSAAEGCGPGPPVGFVFLARLLVAFFAAALLSASVRAYLVVRRAVDGVPFTALADWPSK